MRLQNRINTYQNTKTKSLTFNATSITIHHIAYSSLHKILCANIDHCTSDSLSRVEAESMIFISFPRVKYSLRVDCSFINCVWYSHIDKFTAFYRNNTLENTQTTSSCRGGNFEPFIYEHVKFFMLKYHRRTPSLASSNSAFVEGSIGRNFFKKLSSPR